MEKSKMNKFQYNERIYNYKHGLVNSAENQTVVHSGIEENQTVEHSSENEEHIEHALPGTPGSYNYNSNRAKGWEWDDHKYIRKEERADGTVKYIYADGSSRIEDTNKVLGKPMRTAATGGTPGGSYTPPMNRTPSNTPVNKSTTPVSNNANNAQNIINDVNNGMHYADLMKKYQVSKEYLEDLVSNSTTGIPNTFYNVPNYARMNNTPGGSTYRKPVPGTPTGPLGNGVTNSQPRDTFKANLKMGQGGTPTGLTGTYKKTDPAKVDQARAVLTAQGYKKEADKNAAERALYDGKGGTPTGLTGTYTPMSEQKMNQLQGKGTPGGATGPSTTAGKYSAEVWSNIKNAISQMGANKANAAANGETDLTAIEAANPYMSKWTSSAYGLAHGLLGDYLRENYGSDPRFFDENGVAISGTDTNKILYAEDPNYRDLANKIFEAEMFGDIQPGENYYRDLLAAVGYPIPDEYFEEKNTEPAPQKNTIADFANAITDNGQITPQSEETPAKAPDPIAHYKESLNNWISVGNRMNEKANSTFSEDSEYDMADQYNNIQKMNQAVLERTGITYGDALELIRDFRYNNFNSYNAEETEYIANLMDILSEIGSEIFK